MADDIVNALQTANRSASVLQGIANPPQINPLAAIQAGNQAAQAELTTRGMQAQQALGNILQQSTDANGNLDYQKAHTLAAQAGPVVQMGMAAFAKDASGLRGQQITQSSALYDLIGRASASLMNDPSDENIERIRGSLTTAGAPAGALTELERIKAIQDPNARRAEAYKHINAALDGQGMLARGGYGAPEMTDTGTGRVPVQNTPPSPYGPGGATVRPGGVTLGPQPGATGTQFLPYDEQGEIPIIKGVPSRTPKYWQPSLAPLTAVPGINPGGQQIAPSSPGGGGSAPSVTPPPPPPGNTVRPSAPPPAVAPGPQGSLQTSGGVQVASANPGMVPTTGAAPGPPSPAVAGDVAAIRQGMAAAQANPRPPGTQTAVDTRPPFFTQPPQGQPEKLKSDSEIYAADQKAQPQIMTQAQNLGHAYDALTMLKSNTGKGAAGLQALRSFAGTLGITSAATMNEQKLVEVINKYTERAMIDAAGGAATDMARRMAETSNPGTTLGNVANFELMRNDMGKTLQNAAAYQDWAKAHPGDIGGGYPEQRAAHAARTDPRGFVWSMYDDDEKAKINAEVEKNQDKADALHRAIGIADRLKLHPPVTVSPLPRKQSFVAPPMPQQNALTMAG